MKRYWGYTEQERSEMTAEQVEALMATELMEAGVVKVTAPKLLPTVPPALNSESMFGIKSGYSVCSGFGFRSADDAATAMALMIPLDSDYVAGTTYIVESQRQDKLSIEKIGVYSRADIANNRSFAELAAANMKTNGTLSAHYRSDVAAVTKVTENVWDDWRQCQRTADEYRKITNTLSEYLVMCEGNREMAMTFLAKAFPQPDIDDAVEWLAQKCEA